MHAIDYLFCFTKAQDWSSEFSADRWPSASVQQAALGLGPTQVKEINRCLIEHGLITMKDSPTGRRYGRRHEKDDRNIEAYGFDLSLFAVRYAEFKWLAAEDMAERKAMKALRKRRTIALKAITQILETAQEYGFYDDDWRILATETAELAQVLRSIDRLEEMESEVKSLERRWQSSRERLENLLKPVETGPSEPENRPLIYNYNLTPDPNKDTVTTSSTCSSKANRPVPQEPTPGRPIGPVRGKVLGVPADELVQLAPKLKPHLRRPDPNWADIVDAADWLRHDLGVSKELWGDACLAMGRELAAMTIAIVSTKDAEHFKSSPGGYFHGMVAKHITGDLRLERSIWALRNAADPKRYARKTRRSERHLDSRSW